MARELSHFYATPFNAFQTSSRGKIRAGFLLRLHLISLNSKQET